MNPRVAAIQRALRDDGIREWLTAIIGRGQVFPAEAPHTDPTWLGRRALALTILDDAEKAQPGAMAQIIGEANERARTTSHGQNSRAYRGDEGQPLDAEG